MNHCLLEVRVQTAPTVRYTPDNKTPIAEVDAVFDGLRQDDPPSKIKVVGWGRLAEELQTRLKGNEKVIIEGRLRMNTVQRQDGTKEKRAEFTLSKLHLLTQSQFEEQSDVITTSSNNEKLNSNEINNSNLQKEVGWDTSPLVPDTDEIPF